MHKVLALNIEKCTGCKMCELACSMKHYGEFNPRQSRIHVYNFHKEAYSVPLVCLQCEEAWCMNICPTGAITTSTDTERGIKVVKVNGEKCAGCKMCVFACPFGNMTLNEDGYASKCDLCNGEPECVIFCARGALKFVDEVDSNKSRGRTAAKQILNSHRNCLEYR